MYVELLSSVLADQMDRAVTGDVLLARALDCRARVYRDPVGPQGSVHQELADQVAYDSALVHLCEARGIHVDPQRFARPGAERDRLEGALTRGGLDLSHAHPKRV